MSLHRYNPKRDGTEKAIVQALEAAGCSVARLSASGIPDLLVARGGAIVGLLEVKSARGTLTDDQVRWRLRWRGPAPVTVRTVDEALMACGLSR